MRRTAFIHLPLWPAQRRAPKAACGAPESPTAFVALSANAERIAALNAAGHGAGLRVGQTLADARAIAPGLLCLAHNPAEDAASLRRLARWAQRFSPSVTPLTPDPARGVDGHGLFLDAEGVTALFGGEDAWLADLLARLTQAGLSAAGALADNPAQAYGLGAFHPAAAGAGGLAAPAGQGLGLLSPLPLGALRLAPATAAGLAALGLKSVGQVLSTPRAGLARRFGQALLSAVDALCGTEALALTPVRPAPAAAARVNLAQPIATLEALQAVAARLGQDLARQLCAQGLGARRMVLTLFCVDARAITLSCAAARPTQDGARLTRLLRERLARAADGLDLGFGVDAAQLIALKPSALQARETAALAPEGAQAQAGALEDLAERLAARLGSQAVLMAVPHASHWPERAQKFAPALAGPSGAAFSEGPERVATLRSRPKATQRAQGLNLEHFPTPLAEPVWSENALERPPLLFKKPEAITALAPLPDGPPAQFRWRRVLHRVARTLGPERISAEWWRADGPTRDYYRVETIEGRRLWLFRLGLYGRETNEPGWFVHGCWP